MPILARGIALSDTLQSKYQAKTGALNRGGGYSYPRALSEFLLKSVVIRIDFKASYSDKRLIYEYNP